LIDSNIFLDGLLSDWSASRAILILAVRRVFTIVLAENVRSEVERNLLEFLAQDPQRGSALIDTHDQLIKRLHLERVPLTTPEEVLKHRHLIRHAADVPVLVAAIKSQPDWLVTKHTHHFTQEVAQRTGLKIIHPDRLIKVLQIRG
jgi:predicted nucleic acid-binding protein